MISLKRHSLFMRISWFWHRAIWSFAKVRRWFKSIFRRPQNQIQRVLNPAYHEGPCLTFSISQDENHKTSCDSVQDHKMSCDFTDCTCTLLWSLTHVLKTSYCIRKTSIVFWFWTFRVVRMVLPMVNNHSAPIVCQLCDSILWYHKIILWYHKMDTTCDITRCILWFYKGLDYS